MTPTIKKILIVASIAGNVLLIIYYMRFTDLQTEQANTESVLNEKEAVIENVLLDNGRLKQEKQTAVLQAGRDARNKMKDYYQEEIKDLKDNHDIKVKDLHSYYRAKLETKSEGSTVVSDTTIITEDSIRVQYPKIRLDDGYLSLSGWFTETRFNYEYTVTDSLSVAYSWKYKGIWPFKKRESLNISFSSQNPNTRLSSVTSIVIEDKKKTRLHIGPYCGYGVDVLNGTLGLQVGVGVSWRFF